jgi:hypothetical protein
MRCSSEPIGEDGARRLAQASVLVEICREGDLLSARRLLASWGAERERILDMKDSRATVLHDGILQGRLSVVKFAIEIGANVDEAISSGPALAFAALRGELEIVRYLLEQGANIELPSQGLGRTPLAGAIAGKQVDVALHLIASGARCDEALMFESQRGATMTVLAARHGLPGVYLALCRKGIMDGLSTSPLARAMRHGDVKVVAACLADPVFCAPARAESLDPELLEGVEESLRETLLAWRSADAVAGAARNACAGGGSTRPSGSGGLAPL